MKAFRRIPSFLCRYRQENAYICTKHQKFYADNVQGVHEEQHSAFCHYGRAEDVLLPWLA